MIRLVPLLLAVGLLTPVAAGALVAVMVVAVATTHWRSGFWKGIPPVVEGLGWETYEEVQQNFTRLLFTMMNPNALLSMGWKWQRGDVARNTGGDLAAAPVLVKPRFAPDSPRR